MARPRAEVIGLPFVLSRRHGIISVDPHPTNGIRNHCHSVSSLSGAVAPAAHPHYAWCANASPLVVPGAPTSPPWPASRVGWRGPRSTPPLSARRAGVLTSRPTVSGEAPRNRWNDIGHSRPGNGGSTGGLMRNHAAHGGSPGRLLDRLSLRRVVLRITRSRSCPRGVVGDEPVPIAYPIDAWRLSRPPRGWAPGPGGRQRGASGREVRTATTTSWIAWLATAASASSEMSESWVASACRWRLLVDSVAMRSCFDCH
jgi:hypothetical protein